MLGSISKNVQLSICLCHTGIHLCGRFSACKDDPPWTIIPTRTMAYQIKSVYGCKFSVKKISSVIPVKFAIDAIFAISEDDSLTLAPYQVENLSFASEFPRYNHNTEHFWYDINKISEHLTSVILKRGTWGKWKLRKGDQKHGCSYGEIDYGLNWFKTKMICLFNY